MALSPVLQGMLWMIASTASFSAMIIAVRFLSETIPPFEQVLLRSVIGLAITLPTVICVAGHALKTFRPNRLGGLYAMRAFCTFTGVSAWFFAIAAMPLAEAVAAGLSAGQSFGALQRTAIDRLEKTGFNKVEYLDLRAADDLHLLDAPTRPARLFAAAWLAGVRLIDNIAV